MIRRFIIDENREFLEKVYIGTDREIRSLYKKLKEHEELELRPVFSGKPKFRENAVYGLHIKNDGKYVIINSDTVVKLLMSDNFVNVETGYVTFDYGDLHSIHTVYTPA